jgi:hypothetical protein
MLVELRSRGRLYKTSDFQQSCGLFSRSFSSVLSKEIHEQIGRLGIVSHFEWRTAQDMIQPLEYRRMSVRQSAHLAMAGGALFPCEQTDEAFAVKRKA